MKVVTFFPVQLIIKSPASTHLQLITAPCFLRMFPLLHTIIILCMDRDQVNRIDRNYDDTQFFQITSVTATRKNLEGCCLSPGYWKIMQLWHNGLAFSKQTNYIKEVQLRSFL